MKHLRRFNESNNDADYSIAWDKFEKMMPGDSEIQDEFYEILDGEQDIEDKYSEMEEFLEIWIEEDVFYKYANNGNLRDFAKYIIDNQ